MQVLEDWERQEWECRRAIENRLTEKAQRQVDDWRWRTIVVWPEFKYVHPRRWWKGSA